MSRTTPAPHGTHARYSSRATRCRCDACRAAHAATVRAWRTRVAARGWVASERGETPHGTNARYGGKGCRCMACTAAHRDYKRERRHFLVSLREPTLFRCPYCGGKSSDPAGHPACRARRRA